MPTPYVSKLAREHNLSVDEAEKRWAKAKKFAADAGKSEDYAYITGIFKKMMGETALQHALVAALNTSWRKK